MSDFLDNLFYSCYTFQKSGMYSRSEPLELCDNPIQPVNLYRSRSDLKSPTSNMFNESRQMSQSLSFFTMNIMKIDRF